MKSGLIQCIFFFLFTLGKEQSAREYSFLICFTFDHIDVVGFKNICLIHTAAL